MRPEVSSNPVRLLFVAPVAGLVVCGAIGAVRLLLGLDVWSAACPAATGFVGGVLSILYVLPLLTWTDLRKSVPFAYGLALIAGVASALTLERRTSIPAELVAVPVHVLLCGVSAVLFRQTERRAMECPQCRYVVRGVPLPRCPECGVDLTPWIRR